jgi:hypothetical protein
LISLHLLPRWFSTEVHYAPHRRVVLHHAFVLGARNRVDNGPLVEFFNQFVSFVFVFGVNLLLNFLHVEVQNYAFHFTLGFHVLLELLLPQDHILHFFLVLILFAVDFWKYKSVIESFVVLFLFDLRISEPVEIAFFFDGMRVTFEQQLILNKVDVSGRRVVVNLFKQWHFLPQFD